MQNNLQRLRSWIDQFSAPGVGMFLYLVSLSFYWSNLSFLIFTIPYISTLIPLSSLTRSRDSSRVVEINLSLVSILLLTFLLLYGLSVFFSSDPNNSLQYSSAWPAAILLYVLIVREHNKDDWEILCWGFTIYALITSLLLVFNGLSSTDATPQELVIAVASPLIIVPNDVIMLALSSAFAWYLLTTNVNRITVSLAALSILCVLITIVMVESRSALIVFLACTTIYMFSYRASMIRLKLLLLIPALLVAGLAVDFVLGFPFLNKFQSIPSSRLVLWLAAMDGAVNEPFIGQGPFTFAEYYGNYLATASLPEWMVVDDRRIPWPHNLFVEIAYGSGFIALLIFVGMLLVSFRNLLLLSARSIAMRQKVFVLLAVFISSMAAALIELSLIRVWVVMLLVVILALIENLQSNRTESAALAR